MSDPVRKLIKTLSKKSICNEIDSLINYKEFLGKGVEAQVWLGCFPKYDCNLDFAVKKYSNIEEDETYDYIESSVKRLIQLNNLVPGVFIDTYAALYCKNSIYVFMDIGPYTITQNSESFDEFQWISIFTSIADYLTRLKNLNQYHGDLSFDNILVRVNMDDDPVITFIDPGTRSSSYTADNDVEYLLTNIKHFHKKVLPESLQSITRLKHKSVDNLVSYLNKKLENLTK